jgi:uncharacterized protein DUF6527
VRPETFTVEYNGAPLVFDRMGTADQYYVECPRCRERRGADYFGRNAITVGAGGWSLTFDEQGRATVSPSILCRSSWQGEPECGWHIVIENGVARDV